MNTRVISRALLPAVLASTGVLAPMSARAAYQDGVVPADTVVRLRLEDRLSSRDARPGQTFASVLSPEDRSGFPTGTRFQGVVTDVERYSGERPGMLDVRVQRAYLPDGQRVDLDGRLASLAEDKVRRTSDGRIEARKGGSGSADWKWAGYGAAGGAILAEVLGGQWWKGLLIGGVGGAVYGYLNRNKGSKDFRDVDLPSGTEFGMRLDDRVAFNDRGGYRYSARRVDDGPADRYTERYTPTSDRYSERPAPRDDRYAERPDPRDERYNERPVEEDERYQDRYTDDRAPAGPATAPAASRFSSAVVRMDGQPVRFNDQRPRDVNGVLYVPLKPVADAARMRFLHRQGADSFVLDTRDGLVDGRAGDSRVYTSSGEPIRLDEAPVVHEGTVFVSAEFLSRVAGMRTSWDRGNMELSLESAR